MLMKHRSNSADIPHHRLLEGLQQNISRHVNASEYIPDVVQHARRHIRHTGLARRLYELVMQFFSLCLSLFPLVHLDLEGRICRFKFLVLFQNLEAGQIQLAIRLPEGRIRSIEFGNIVEGDQGPSHRGRVVHNRHGINDELS